MKVLKIILWVCGIAFLLSFVGLLIPWRVMAACIERVGIEVSVVAPFKAYIARLTLGCSGLAGIFFVILATDPLRYGPMLPLAGCGLIFMGLICLVGGIRYDLPAVMFYLDMVFGLVGGALILAFRAKALFEQTPRPRRGEPIP